MCSNAASEPASTPSCAESVGNKVDGFIVSIFSKLGRFCSYRPKTTIAIALTIAVACAGGMAKLNTENRPDKVFIADRCHIHPRSFVRCLTHYASFSRLPAMGAAEHRGGKGAGCISLLLPSHLKVRKCYCHRKS